MDFLRPYQKLAADSILKEWETKQSTMVVLPTGAGKTCLFAAVIHNRLPGRALVLAHREELIFQARDKIQKFTGLECEIEMGELTASKSFWSTMPVVIATVQTLVSGRVRPRMEKFNPLDFSTIVIDEFHHCFPAQTLIDGRPISTIRVGDAVDSFNHEKARIEKRKVLRLYRHPCPSLVRVRFTDGRQMVCTPNHPVFTNYGYRKALTLDGSCVVFTNHEHKTTNADLSELPEIPSGKECIGNSILPEVLLASVQESVVKGSCIQEDCVAVHPMRSHSNLSGQSGTDSSSQGQSVLRGCLHGGAYEEDIIRADGEDESNLCFRENDATQSGEATRGSGENISNQEGTCVSESRGQREIDQASTDACRSTPIPNGTSNQDGIGKGIVSADCIRLQGGHCIHSFEVGNRNRWQFPFWEKINSGSKEDRCLECVGVDSVEILQRGSDGKFGEVCEDGFVYNFEVEGNNNYFADGVLVHNCTALSYRKILDYFKLNPDIKVLGVTATPDRTDEEALGQVCDSVAFNYSITEAISDGWLVPISCQMVSIAGLDFSSVRTTAGDLNGADLAAIMEAEEVCQGVCSATLDIIGDKQTIVFTPSVKHAEMACAIFNRHKAGIAEWVSGKTEKEARRKIMDNVVSGKTQILCNVGVATEGFDAPGVEVIVMARPTKSRALYAQMAGRATRPQAGLVDQFATATERRTAISSSKKPHAMLIDFVGNSGRHKLINGLDLLGGKYTEAERRVAKEIIADGDIHDIEDALEDARDAIIAKEMAEREMQKQLEEARKRKLVAKAKWTSSSINPFDAFDIRPVHPSVNQRHPLTSKQKDILRKQGIDPDKMSNDQAKQLLDEQFRRWNKDLCSVKQSALLNSHGYDGANMKRDQAKRIIDALAKNRWKKLPPEHQLSVARNRVTAKPLGKNEW